MEIRTVTFFSAFSFVLYALSARVKFLGGTIYATDEMIGCSCTCQMRLRDLGIYFFLLTFPFQMIHSHFCGLSLIFLAVYFIWLDGLRHIVGGSTPSKAFIFVFLAFCVTLSFSNYRWLIV